MDKRKRVSLFKQLKMKSGVYEGILYKKVLTVNKEVFMEEVYKEIF